MHANHQDGKEFSLLNYAAVVKRAIEGRGGEQGCFSVQVRVTGLRQTMRSDNAASSACGEDQSLDAHSSSRLFGMGASPEKDHCADG